MGGISGRGHRDQIARARHGQPSEAVRGSVTELRGSTSAPARRVAAAGVTAWWRVRAGAAQAPDCAFFAKLSMKVLFRSTLELVSSGSSSFSESYMLFMPSALAMPVRE